MTTKDDPAIRAVLDAYAAAIRDKDAAAVIALFTDDAVAYDLAPPLALEGADLRDPAGLQKWFDTWRTPIRVESRDLTIRSGGDVAFAYALRHMTGTKTGGEAVDLWYRSTAGLERRQGRWKIVHVHDSVPFAMDGSDRALLDLEP